MPRWRPRRDGLSDAERWHGLMPHGWAREQIQWERRHALLRARLAGATVESLAAWLREPWPYVAFVIDRAWQEAQTGKRSPAERWIALGAADGWGLRRAAPAMAAE